MTSTTGTMIEYGPWTGSMPTVKVIFDSDENFRRNIGMVGCLLKGYYSTIDVLKRDDGSYS
jgi:hypothetical protein